MNCCIKCFESNYISSIILNNNTEGDCDYCKSTNVNIYKSSELNIFFKNILNLYETNNKVGKPIEKQIITDFPKKIFSERLIFSEGVKQLIDL